jgi:hypothetical protein
VKLELKAGMSNWSIKVMVMFTIGYTELAGFGLVIPFPLAPLFRIAFKK